VTIKISMKMEKLVYKPKLLMLTASVLFTLSVAAQEVSKDFHQEYKADNNTTLDLSNKYGDVTVTGWDNNQIVIDVKVTVRHPDRSRAEKYLGQINVSFSQNGNTIYAKTEIEDNFNFTGWGSNRDFKINYTVKMPYSGNLTLSNKYGNTDVDELRGLLNVDVKYGGFQAGKLTRGNEKPFNRIAVAYGKANITEAGWLDIYVRYTSPFTVGKSTALLVDSKYSKLKIGETSSVVTEAKYDTYNIEKINNLVVSSGYTNVTVGSLARKVSFEGSYGSLNIDQIPAGFESVDVDVRYSGVRLGIAENASYQLDAKSSYGGIKYNDENFRFTRRIVENTSSEISGVVGKDEAAASVVKVRTSYGTVKLF